MDWYPLIVLGIGVSVVLVLILALRINAFVALITAALVVSMLAPGEMEEKVPRVAAAFGSVAGAIGIVIALAAVIGRCLMESGAATRIVMGFSRLFGEKRTPIAFTASGYLLSVPVFFDTVLYLLVPLVRSLYRKTKKNYILCLSAMAAGGAVTHSMVPPTPGPLFMANELKVDLGTMMLVGALIAIPMSVAGFFVCRILDRKLPIPMRPYPGEEEEEELDESVLPPLWLSLLPVLLPVVLISSNTFAKALGWESVLGVTGIVGNPNIALLFSAVIALALVMIYRGHSLKHLAEGTEHALLGAGLIILITAAGGAFGAMLREAGIQESVKAMIGEDSESGGLVVLLAAFGVASLIKFAQGSGTVSMITTASMFAAMEFNAEILRFHPVYLACMIGSGSMVGDWMNNSGFWVFSKMGCLTTVETLKTWTVLTAVLGIVGGVTTLLAASFLPLT